MIEDGLVHRSDPDMHRNALIDAIQLYNMLGTKFLDFLFAITKLSENLRSTELDDSNVSPYSTRSDLPRWYAERAKAAAEL